MAKRAKLKQIPKEAPVEEEKKETGREASGGAGRDRQIATVSRYEGRDGKRMRGKTEVEAIGQ